MRFTTKLLDVIAISLRRRDAAGRSMGLIEKSRISEIRHDIANGSGAQTFAASARQRARADRLPAGNECLDDSGKDFPFPSARWPCWHIFPSLGAETPH